MGVGLVLSFLPGSGHDTGAGVMLSSSSRRSLHQHLIPSPITISKRKPGKQAGGGRITSAIASRRANGGQASKTRTTDGLASIPIITRSHGLPIPHPHHINRPAHSTSTQRDARRDAGTRERQADRRSERDEHGDNDGRRGERWNENARAPQDNKQATRRRARRTARRERDGGTRRRTRRKRQGKKQAAGARIGGREKQMTHFLISRPTPSRRLLSVCLLKLFTRPPGVGRAGGEA